jgi:hypothetical protein
MARGSDIIVTADPKGRWIEGKLDIGITPKPGTILQIKASSGIDNNGRFTFELYNADADGGRPKGPWLILDMDSLRGINQTTAYAAGDAVRCYVPMPGEEFNLLLADISGTADDHTKGEMLIVDDTTGLLIATTGSPETEPFQLLETIIDPTANQLVHVIFTGY